MAQPRNPDTGRGNPTQGNPLVRGITYVPERSLKRKVDRGVRAALNAGVRNDPDVLGPDPQCPEALNELVLMFRQLMLLEAAERAAQHAEDVAFIVSYGFHLQATQAAGAGTGGVGLRDDDRRAQCQRHAASLIAAQTSHTHVLAAMATWGNEELTRAVKAWRRAHPHSKHLDSIKVPVLEVPAEAYDFGQSVLAETLHTGHSGPGDQSGPSTHSPDA